MISKNLLRRHMSDSQRAMVAAKLADMPQGARSDLRPIGAMSTAQAADALNVGERSVTRAKAVRKYGNEKLVKAVEAGEMSVSAAARKARPLPTAENKKRDQDQQYDVDVDAVSEAGAHAYKKQTEYGAGSDAIGGFEGLCRAWNACSEDEQGRFLIHISWDVVEELRKERDDLKRALDKQKAKTKDAKATESDVLDQLKPRRGELAEARDKQEPLHAEIKRLSTDRQTSDDDPFGLKDIPDFLHRTSGKTEPARRSRKVWHTAPAMKVAGERDRAKRDKIAVRSTVWKAVHAGADTLGKIRRTTDLSDALIKSALRFHVKERAVLKNGKRYSTIGSESRS